MTRALPKGAAAATQMVAGMAGEAGASGLPAEFRPAPRQGALWLWGVLLPITRVRRLFQP